MAHISKKSTDCSGCTACATACPVKAISMETDDEGFYIPSVSIDKCIDCGICIDTCPTFSNVIKSKDNNLAYAFQNSDVDVLYKSSSGAFFPSIAKEFIEQGGYVCGCVLNDDLMPEHIVTNRLEDIARMQDSKYVQSDMNHCYGEIESLLNDGKTVLFTGTSCQVAGLKNLLVTKKIDDRNLICIDFFCHGVPSPLIWKEYIILYENETHKKVVKFRFRNKKYGWGKKSRGTYHLNTVTRDTIFRKNDDVSLLGRMWYSIFFSNLCLRNYCYNCPYTNIDKPSDVTMADFWGVEDLLENFSDGKGCSLVITHNSKGYDLVEALKGKEKILEVPIEVAIKRQGNAFHPSKKPETRTEFWEDYRRDGFKRVTAKYFRYDTMHKLKDFLHRVFFEFHLTDLYK